MKSIYDILPEDVKLDPGVPEIDYVSLSGKAFAQAVLDSPEFRRYIVNSITLGIIAPALVTRLMDYGWGKPVERVEHAGVAGQPIVTEVRRVIVHVNGMELGEESDDDTKPTMH